jgi:predicted nucleic acid-binding protein
MNWSGICSELPKSITAIGSVLIITEFMTAVFVRFASSAVKKIRSSLLALKIAYLPVTEPIALEAARLRAAYRLRTLDAFHVATALASRADVIVTNDKRLYRVEVEGIRVAQSAGAGK